jgi:hypothetical protein
MASDTSMCCPQGALARELTELRSAAGGPSLRSISKELRDPRYPEYASHETIRKALMCVGVPRWSTVASIVMVLVGRCIISRDLEIEMAKFMQLWRDASIQGSACMKSAARDSKSNGCRQYITHSSSRLTECSER